MATILVTGGAGFIGSNFIKYVLAERDEQIVNLDALTYAGNLANLADIDGEPRYRFVRGSIGDSELVDSLLRELQPDYLVNFAAETHVDRSILSPTAFLETNILGTQVLLQAARAIEGLRFTQVSTDEVYGSADNGERFAEDAAYNPTSPYAASKASADLMVLAYHKTYGLDTTITRCANNYGPYQFPEKLIPLMIANALEDKPLPVYGDGRQVRSWIHAEDHARGIYLVMKGGRPGEIYNIDCGVEKYNLDVVHAILALLDKPATLIRYVTDRPAHDRRYAITWDKIEGELGWTPRIDFETGLEQTVAWYRDNQPWVRRIQDKSYLSYYQEQYGQRL
ncbi:MAG: dTDP-glucose 4,6-dehydratase [Myxococcales bacterium]|nr:dTDP-glucose 4,6-dehydratase [Myxococcales bacterium]